ncbi:MAG: VCBS repeat-containing protein [Pirellulales bacterium]|nr:VCBS repeat-containing protein [Pirellulales bacterium]
MSVKNPGFEEGVGENGVPVGWGSRGRADAKGSRGLAMIKGNAALMLHDDNAEGGVGVMQDVPFKPGASYRISARVRRVAAGVSAFGARLHLEFQPSHKMIGCKLDAQSAERWGLCAVEGICPEGTTKATLIVYTRTAPTPRVLVDDVEIEEFTPPPKPIPPVYTKLKNLYLDTAIVEDGKAAVTIVGPAYPEGAREIQAATQRLTGCAVPIADNAPLPLKGNLILLGNRSTNGVISALYDRWNTCLDLKYPGREGCVVRTLHNPFGKGCNIILVGGSDTGGVAKATRAFIAALDRASAKRGALSVGRLMEIQLGKGLVAPSRVEDVKTWDASPGYKSTSYFGWNVLSKLMAIYYMTGQEWAAREFARLAFPDAKGVRDLQRLGAGDFNKIDEPVSQCYHYTAYTMILLWDLIEESPVFTDAERLKITNAFSQQLAHWAEEGSYSRRGPMTEISSRHPQWSAICLYVLGRYFNTYYPAPVWEESMASPTRYMSYRRDPIRAVVSNDSTFWYNTLIAPSFTWMALTGDRAGVKNGHLRCLLRGLEILATGEDLCWATRSTSMGMLHKAAYLTGDGRWIYYRDRLRLDTDCFRVGQSFWPGENLKPTPPTDMLDTWYAYRPTRSLWRSRINGLPFEQSFIFASYRNAVDSTGDFIQLDGSLATASRNPFHNYTIQRLRLNDCNVLESLHNQVFTSADGMVEPTVAKDGALYDMDTLGDTAVVVGGSPNAPFADWRRTVLLRKHRYALILDELTFRSHTKNMKVRTTWQPVGGHWNPKQQAITGIGGNEIWGLPKGWRSISVRDHACIASDPGLLTPADSRGRVMLTANGPGEWLEMTFELKTPVEGELFANFLAYTNRAMVCVSLDGQRAAQDFDHFSHNEKHMQVSLGNRELAAGRHRVRVEVVGKSPESLGYMVGFFGLLIKPQGTPALPVSNVSELRPSEVSDVTGNKQVKMDWIGPAQPGQVRRCFYLIGQLPPGSTNPLACLRVSDNVAVLALPQPALAVAGKGEGVQADIAVLGVDHLYGRGLRQADGFLSADTPVEIDWNFSTGLLNAVTKQNTHLTIDEKQIPLTPGRHAITDLHPDAATLARWRKRLATLLLKGRQIRQEQLTALAGEPVLEDVPAWPAAMSLELPDSATDIRFIDTPDGKRIAIAAGKSVRLLDLKLKLAREVQADGEVRHLRWWPEHKLLLAGCADEKVIAFKLNGKRRWTFVSKMAPALAKSNETWYYKSYPGCGGVHGLYTATFLNGESQVFVGSSCTLEILNARGECVKRLKVNWGLIREFLTFDRDDGTRDLAMALNRNGYDRIISLNNKTMRLRYGYDQLPPGNTSLKSWMGIQRVHIFKQDMDGDGKQQFVSASTGVWNNVSIWSAAGKPLYNAQFGPGAKGVNANLRDMDVADLEGDGKKEILIATADGLIVALNNHCEKLWAKRLLSPPSVLRCCPAPDGRSSQIVAGCDNGAVLLMDRQGKILGAGEIRGRPVRIAVQPDSKLPLVILGSSKGEIKGFKTRR